MSKLPLLCLCLAATSAVAGAQPAPADPWNGATKAIAAAMAKTKFPAVTAAVARNGRIEYLRAFGLSDIENATRARVDSVFRIASISKPITATAVLQLVESGRISLDTSIARYVATLPPAYEKVTVRDLLRHSGGVRHYKDDAEYITTRKCDRLADALEIFSGDPLDHQPGDKITYSTWGYTLLGLAIESASGLSFADYVKQRIFQPAAMTASRVDTLEIIPNRAEGYTSAKDGTIRNADLLDTSCRIPAGGFVSTAADLARFSIALNGGLLLKPATLAEMTRNQITPQMIAGTVKGMDLPKDFVFPGFGLGWALHEVAGETNVQHGGNQPGVTTMLYHVPARDLTVVLLTNLDSKGSEITALANAVAASVPVQLAR